MLTAPPKFGIKILEFFCKKELIEYILGDLEEQFSYDVEKKNLSLAKVRFIWHVVKFLRPGIIKSLEGNQKLNQFGMFNNYLKVGIRNSARHKVFSIINIAGLAVGITCCLLIFLYVNDELSHDKYHTRYDDIYRVTHSYQNSSAEAGERPPAPEEYQVWGNAPVGPALLEYFPGVEKVFQFTSPNTFLFQYENKKFQEEGVVFADSTAFEVFSWKMIHGDKKHALEGPNKIVLTQSMAQRYFSDDNPVGQTIKVGERFSYLVSGVMEDIPDNSHFSFDAMVSMATFRNIRPRIFGSWDYVDFYTYFILNPETPIDQLRNQVPEFLTEHLKEFSKYTFDFEPLSLAYLGSLAGRQPGKTGNLSNLYIFSSIAVFILLIACINFMNLSTARSVQRAKEVGVRKTMGAQKKQLVYQFLAESIFLTIISGLLALALLVLAFPYVEEISGKELSTGILFHFESVMTFASALIIVGFMAGSYPAWILSNFRPTQVLKGKLKASTHGATLRKGLVILQFCLSMILIVGTWVVYSQLHHLQNRDLGFNQEQMLVVDFGWDGKVQQQLAPIKAELLNVSGVQSISASRATPGDFFPNAGTGIEPPEGGELLFLGPGIYEIDADFIPTYEMEMAAGRPYKGGSPQDSTMALIINESAAKQYGYHNVNDIIGKKFFQWGREGKVIGVLKDFNYKSLHNAVEPLSIRFAPVNELRKFSLRLNTPDIGKTLIALEEKWGELVPHRPFVYNFLDEAFNRQYQADQQFGNIFGVFSGLAIFIACLGLFGLTAYTATQRTKEIGIRKTLGASVLNIISLLSKDFVKLFLLSIAIGIPVSWYFMSKWLEGFAYRIGIGVEVFIFAGLIVIIVASLTISWQAIKAAVQNPVHALHNE